MMSPFCTIVPFNDNQKEPINHLLDIIIKKGENDESLIPTDEEFEAGLKASKDKLIEERDTRTNPEEIKEIDAIISGLEDFYRRIIHHMKSYDEDTINDMLTSARWIRENQRCPVHLSLRMYYTFGNSEFAQYIEMLRCLEEECHNMFLYDGLDIQFSETENPRVMVGVISKKGETYEQ